MEHAAQSSQRRRDGWQVVTASREVGRHRRQVPVSPHVQDQIHTDQYVEQEVAMEQPVSCEGGIDRLNYSACGIDVTREASIAIFHGRCDSFLPDKICSRP